MKSGGEQGKADEPGRWQASRRCLRERIAQRCVARYMRELTLSCAARFLERLDISDHERFTIWEGIVLPEIRRRRFTWLDVRRASVMAIRRYTLAAAEAPHDDAMARAWEMLDELPLTIEEYRQVSRTLKRMAEHNRRRWPGRF